MQMASLNYVLPALAAEETRVVTIARQRGLCPANSYLRPLWASEIVPGNENAK